MVILAGSLASGRVAATKQTIYTSLNLSYIKTITFLNTGGSQQSIIVYGNLVIDGTSRQIRRIILDPGQSYRLFGKDDAYSMSAGDLLEAESTNANVVDYIVAGGTE